MFKLLFYLGIGLLSWAAYDYLSAEQPETTLLGGLLARSVPIETDSLPPLRDIKALFNADDGSADPGQLMQRLDEHRQALQQALQDNPRAGEELRRIQQQLADSNDGKLENLDLDQLMDQVKQLYQQLGDSEATERR